MHVRQPAVAGSFYEKDADCLARGVDALVAGASRSSGPYKALIVPHAGYVYSGPVAASAYATLRPVAGSIRRVVLLGPAHFHGFKGLALPGDAAFATPLGEVPIDEEAVSKLRLLPFVTVSPRAHAPEHSLEVQLPFLQRLLPRFTLVPLLVGQATSEEVASALELLWGEEDTLVLISTDLSHYLPYEQAQRVDRATAEKIEALAAEQLESDEACGARPLRGLLLAARKLGLSVERLDLRSSGDTQGDRSRVVGYGAFGLRAPSSAAKLSPSTEGKTLLRLARGSVEEALGGGRTIIPDEPWLHEHGATFVTLSQKGQLRGCIGSIEAHRPLGVDVMHNARAAALEDPRFAPLTYAELSHTRVEVCVLSPREELFVQTEEQTLALLRPHQDGVVLECGARRGVFIPKVWQSLPEPERFLAMLKLKAGLPTAGWPKGTRVFRFTASAYEEEESS